MANNDIYEVVIGLEVHVELATETKIFCGCPTTFGAAPNTQCCPVCMGMPGTLPVLNEKVVEYAARAGIATHCTLTTRGRQDRKNYFYPDLPKAYQISQSQLPIAEHGYLDIQVEDNTRRIGITRIHIEEDAGKLVHDGGEGTLIDYNRCGVPLIEIVSEPDLRSAEEVKAYLQKLRAMVMYLGVSSGKMNEGAFRCDVNLSIRKHGETAFGTRTEMKNLNSFAFIAKAIESETARQIKVIESGGQVTQETRRWDAAKGVSAAMRSKEDAHDYRYFPDPDLMPIIIDDEMQASLRASMPLLPDDYIDQYTKQYGIKPEVADALVSDKAVAEYFESVVKEVKDADMLANFMMTEVKRLMATGEEESAIGMSVHQLASLINLASSEKINLSIAKKVADKIWNTDILPKDYIDSEDLWPIVDRTVLEAFADQVLTQNPRILSDYLGGKTQAFGAYMGQMMRLTKGKADPGVSEQIFMDRIQK